MIEQVAGAAGFYTAPTQTLWDQAETVDFPQMLRQAHSRQEAAQATFGVQALSGDYSANPDISMTSSSFGLAIAYSDVSLNSDPAALIKGLIGLARASTWLARGVYALALEQLFTGGKPLPSPWRPENFPTSSELSTALGQAKQVADNTIENVSQAVGNGYKLAAQSSRAGLEALGELRNNPKIQNFIHALETLRHDSKMMEGVTAIASRLGIQPEPIENKLKQLLVQADEIQSALEATETATQNNPLPRTTAMGGNNGTGSQHLANGENTALQAPPIRSLAEETGRSDKTSNSPKQTSVEPNPSVPITKSEPGNQPELQIEVTKLDGNPLDDLVVQRSELMNKESPVDIHIWLENGQKLGHDQAVILSSPENDEQGNIEFQHPITGDWKKSLALLLSPNGSVKTIKARGTDVSREANDVEVTVEPVYKGNNVQPDEENLTVFAFEQAHLNVKQGFPYDLRVISDGDRKVYGPINPDNPNRLSAAVIYEADATITPQLPEGAEETDPIKGWRLGLVQEIWHAVDAPDGSGRTLPAEFTARYAITGVSAGELRQQGKITEDNTFTIHEFPVRPSSIGMDLTYSVPKALAIKAVRTPGQILLDAERDEGAPFYTKEPDGYASFTRASVGAPLSASLATRDFPNLKHTTFVSIPLLDDQGNAIDEILYEFSSAHLTTTFEAHLVVHNEQNGSVIPLRQQRCTLDVDSRRLGEQTAHPDLHGSRKSTRAPELDAPLSEEVERRIKINGTVDQDSFTLKNPNPP